MNNKMKQQLDKEEEGKIALNLLEENKIKEISRIIELGFFNCKTITGAIPQPTLDKMAQKILDLT